MANTPKPITRKDRYYDYLINGGDFDLLPKPIQRQEMYLYYLCSIRYDDGGDADHQVSLNTKNSDGYVAAGGDNAEKYWGTDAGGNPAWRGIPIFNGKNNGLVEKPSLYGRGNVLSDNGKWVDPVAKTFKHCEWGYSGAAEAADESIVLLSLNYVYLGIFNGSAISEDYVEKSDDVINIILFFPRYIYNASAGDSSNEWKWFSLGSWKASTSTPSRWTISTINDGENIVIKVPKGSRVYAGFYRLDN